MNRRPKSNNAAFCRSAATFWWGSAGRSVQSPKSKVQSPRSARRGSDRPTGFCFVAFGFFRSRAVKSAFGPTRRISCAPVRVLPPCVRPFPAPAICPPAGVSRCPAGGEWRRQTWPVRPRRSTSYSRKSPQSNPPSRIICGREAGGRRQNAGRRSASAGEWNGLSNLFAAGRFFLGRGGQRRNGE